MQESQRMIGHPFELEDLFTAGIGCDLGGAFLLARGLINRPAELTRLAGSFWGSNSYQAVDVAKNRLDAIAGVSCLGVGFILQATGYIATLSRPHQTRTGIEDVLVAIVVSATALVLTIIVGTWLRKLRLLPLLIEMSRYTMFEQREDFPRAVLLPGWLEALGRTRIEGEDDLAFARRVSGIENMVVDVASRPGVDEIRNRLWTDPPLEGEQP